VPHWTFAFSGHGFHAMAGASAVSAAAFAGTVLTAYAKRIMTIAARKGRAKARTAMSLRPARQRHRAGLSSDES
jgi:hypothetical protein